MRPTRDELLGALPMGHPLAVREEEYHAKVARECGTRGVNHWIGRRQGCDMNWTGDSRVIMTSPGSTVMSMIPIDPSLAAVIARHQKATCWVSFWGDGDRFPPNDPGVADLTRIMHAICETCAAEIE